MPLTFVPVSFGGEPGHERGAIITQDSEIDYAQMQWVMDRSDELYLWDNAQPEHMRLLVLRLKNENGQRSIRDVMAGFGYVPVE